MDTLETKRLTRAAAEEYQARLDQLKNITRLEIAEQIKEARAFGDISENAEYDAAREHQARVEQEISQLEELLTNAEIIDEENVDTTSVNIGARVRLQKDGKEFEYDIVSTSEVDPFARVVTVECANTPNNKKMGYKAGQVVEVVHPARLSNESPVGRALLGHMEGDVVSVVTQKGTSQQYTVLSIDKTADAPVGKVLGERRVMQ